MTPWTDGLKSDQLPECLLREDERRAADCEHEWFMASGGSVKCFKCGLVPQEIGVGSAPEIIVTPGMAWAGRIAYDKCSKGITSGTDAVTAIYRAMRALEGK